MQWPGLKGRLFWFGAGCIMADVIVGADKQNNWAVFHSNLLRLSLARAHRSSLSNAHVPNYQSVGEFGAIRAKLCPPARMGKTNVFGP